MFILLSAKIRRDSYSFADYGDDFHAGQILAGHDVQVVAQVFSRRINRMPRDQVEKCAILVQRDLILGQAKAGQCAVDRRQKHLVVLDQRNQRCVRCLRNAMLHQRIFKVFRLQAWVSADSVAEIFDLAVVDVRGGQPQGHGLDNSATLELVAQGAGGQGASDPVGTGVPAAPTR